MSQSHVSATIPWQEGTEEDFKDLREQLEKLRSLAPEYLGDSNDGEDDSSDDEDVEPGATRGILRKNINILYPSGVDHPGARLLWAAQHDRLEVARELLELQPSLVTFRDEDEYTALHRAAYSHHHNMLGG